MSDALRPLARSAVELLPGRFQQRRDIARAYITSLRTEHLLQNHLFEAGLWFTLGEPQGIHWGWEGPTVEVRGHFLGHWMSAAAELAAATGDDELDGKVRLIARELGRCQRANGGGWVASIPEKYLHWIANGTPRWSPIYTVHKTLMGLYDTWAALGDERSLEVLTEAAEWFVRWTKSLTEAQRQDVLLYESSCIMETWVDLYGVTKDPRHLELAEWFYRDSLFEPLVAGQDVLTNRHANTTIPEALGAARAYEVTGDESWRRHIEAYWDFAVTRRGTFSTGGQTFGEYWTPPFKFASHLGATNQEHCSVYNMMRLAEVLLRWTGDPSYAAYREYNLVNGVLAQQHFQTSMVTYYLGLGAGSVKHWTTPTSGFPCCQGTMVQAASRHHHGIAYESAGGLALAYLAPARVRIERPEGGVEVRMTTPDSKPDELALARLDVVFPESRPDHDRVTVDVAASAPSEFELSLRIPDWIAGPASVRVNDEPVQSNVTPGFLRLSRRWRNDRVEITLPRSLRTIPLPDRPGTVAFADGPLALAGISPDAVPLHGDPTDAATLIEHDGEWVVPYWRDAYRFRPGAGAGRLLALRDIVDETYTVYFPVES